MISRNHRVCMTALDSPWMLNSSLQFLRKKLNAHCVWTQSIIPRLCHVCTHSASSVLTNTQILQEDSYKRQSNVRFVRHLFKFLKETRSRICLHLIISTDWWTRSKRWRHTDPEMQQLWWEQYRFLLLFCLPNIPLYFLFWSSSATEDYKRSSQCCDGEIKSARCSRVDPQTRHVFTAISRKSTAGILLRRMQSSYLPQVQCS